MGKHISTIIYTLLIIIVGCTRHSTESDKSFGDSLVSDKHSGFYFDTIIETGSNRITHEYGTLVYFISKSKTTIPGYMASITTMFKPKNYRQDNLQSLDTLEKQYSLIDIYTIQGNKTSCLAYIDNTTTPSIVMSVKNGEILSKDDLEKIINSFFNAYGLKKGNSILDSFVFFIKEKRQEADKAFDLAAKSTRNCLENMFGSVKCISYDLPSDKGVYENNDTTLLQLRQQIAKQEYIDSMSELANYSKPHKYAQVVASFLKADPETIHFVSDYLTDKQD